MLDAISQILGVIQSVWTFFANFITSFLTFFDVVTSAVSLPLTLIGYMPTIIGTAVVTVVSISTVKLIVGR